MSRIGVAVGLVHQHRDRHPDQPIVLPDAGANAPLLCRLETEAGPHLPDRGDSAIDAWAEGDGVAIVGGKHLAQYFGGDAAVLAGQPPVGLAEIGTKGEARVDDRQPLRNMIHLGGQPEAFGLAEQVAMRPEGADREAELGLVADAEADRARQTVGELDIERQLAVGVERRRRLDAHGIEHAERGELAAQQLDLGGVVELALLEGHAALQVGGAHLVGSREAHRAHSGDRSRCDQEGDLG